MWDRATNWLECMGLSSKTAEESRKAFVRWQGATDKFEYFYSDGLTERMEQWAQAHAHRIDLSLDPGESLLSYSGLFAEWCEMFETALEAFIEGEGGTVRAFYDALADGRKQGAHAAWADDALFVTCLLYTSDAADE